MPATTVCLDSYLHSCINQDSKINAPPFSSQIDQFTNEDHSSNQNDVLEPLLISTLVSCEARGQSFKIFFHIHEPKELFSSTLQKEPFLIRYFRIYCTHRDGPKESMRQINFKQETLLASFRYLRSKPPSSLGLQTSDHSILAF